MPTISRGIKNILRNKLRNTTVLLIISISLSLTLMMVNMNFLLNQKIKSIKGKWGPVFSVELDYEYVKYMISDKKPFKGEEYLFDESIADDILKINSVKSVNRRIGGSFISKRLKQETFVIRNYKGKIETSDQTTNDIPLSGTEDLNDKMFESVKGNIFKRTDIDQNIAVISDIFAERNSLDVGSNIIINGEKIKIIGVYEPETKIPGDTIYIPFKTAQRLLNLEGKVESLTVTVDSIDNIQKTVDYINNKLSDGKIIATTHEEHGLESSFFNRMKNMSKVLIMSSFVTGILVILAIMFINVRQRVREIGILKAIGASNINISAQFLVESITLCTIALILSVIITLAANQTIVDFISEREKSIALKPENVSLIFELLEVKDMEELPEEVKDMFSYKEYMNSMKLEIIFSPQMLMLAILITLLLGVIGSMLPAYYISKLRPAEVLRFE